MKNIANWVQVLGTVSVLAGLALVIIELRQAKELAVIQISSDGHAYNQQLDAMLVGDNLATTMAKLADSKAQLSAEDLYRYDGYAFSKITLIRRSVGLAKLGFYDVDWTTFVDKTTACYFFGHDVGQAYLGGPAVSHDDVVERLTLLSKDCSEEDSYVGYMRKALPAERISE